MEITLYRIDRDQPLSCSNGNNADRTPDTHPAQGQFAPARYAAGVATPGQSSSNAIGAKPTSPRVFLTHTAAVLGHFARDAHYQLPLLLSPFGYHRIAAADRQLPDVTVRRDASHARIGPVAPLTCLSQTEEQAPVHRM